MEEGKGISPPWCSALIGDEVVGPFQTDPVAGGYLVRRHRRLTQVVVTPTFCIIKLCQLRSALGCILERFSLRKRIFQFNWPKVAFIA
jgi:hypothetical protein